MTALMKMTMAMKMTMVMIMCKANAIRALALRESTLLHSVGSRVFNANVFIMIMILMICNTCNSCECSKR